MWTRLERMRQRGPKTQVRRETNPPLLSVLAAVARSRLASRGKLVSPSGGMSVRGQIGRPGWGRKTEQRAVVPRDVGCPAGNGRCVGEKPGTGSFSDEHVPGGVSTWQGATSVSPRFSVVGRKSPRRGLREGGRSSRKEDRTTRFPRGSELWFICAGAKFMAGKRPVPFERASTKVELQIQTKQLPRRAKLRRTRQP